jgi:hypothetical protein
MLLLNKHEELFWFVDRILTICIQTTKNFRIPSMDPYKKILKNFIIQKDLLIRIEYRLGIFLQKNSTNLDALDGGNMCRPPYVQEEMPVGVLGSS